MYDLRRHSLHLLLNWVNTDIAFNTTDGFCSKPTSSNIFSFPSGLGHYKPFSTVLSQWKALGAPKVDCWVLMHEDMRKPVESRSCMKLSMPVLTRQGFSAWKNTFQRTLIKKPLLQRSHGPRHAFALLMTENNFRCSFAKEITTDVILQKGVSNRIVETVHVAWDTAHIIFSWNEHVDLAFYSRSQSLLETHLCDTGGSPRQLEGDEHFFAIVSERNALSDRKGTGSLVLISTFTKRFYRNQVVGWTCMTWWGNAFLLGKIT